MLTFTRTIYNCFDGSHFQGEIVAGYASIVGAFGMPEGGDGYKTDAEWDITFSNGVRATIYNWKDGHNYLGKKDGMALGCIRNWHVGGTSPEAYLAVCEYLNIKQQAA